MYFVVAIVCLIGAALLFGIACFVGSFIRWGTQDWPSAHEHQFKDWDGWHK